MQIKVEKNMSVSKSYDIQNICKPGGKYRLTGLNVHAPNYQLAKKLVKEFSKIQIQKLQQN